MHKWIASFCRASFFFGKATGRRFWNCAALNCWHVYGWLEKDLVAFVYFKQVPFMTQAVQAMFNCVQFIGPCRINFITQMIVCFLQLRALHRQRWIFLSMGKMYSMIRKAQRTKTKTVHRNCLPYAGCIKKLHQEKNQAWFKFGRASARNSVRHRKKHALYELDLQKK